MSDFIVSARKYRPDTFVSVVGQPNITLTLKNAIRNNHLAQAFLFCGPRGVGKTTTARILAKTINCENLTKDTESCNNCNSCQSFSNGQSLNIYELDAASNNSVDDIRALVEQVRYAPQGGKYKVYIIDEVHMLSASAFNAFLKTLEEPPPYAIFILATTEKHKIIPTILSRCQTFDFHRIRVEDIVSQLAMIAKSEGVTAEEDALHVIAQKADGALRDALTMFDQQVSFSGNNLTYKSVSANLNVLDYDYYFRVTDEVMKGDMSAVLLIFNDILNYGFDGHNFITGLASHLRDILVCKDEETVKLMEVSQSVKERYKIQSRQISSALLMELLNIANQCDMSYRSARHQRLHVELALMKMCALQTDKKKVEPVEEFKGNNTRLTDKPPVPTVPPPSKPVISAASEPPPASLKPQPVAKPTASLRSSLISINGNNGQKKNEEVKATPENNFGNNPFTAEQIEQAWNEFASVMEKQGRLTLHTALKKRLPQMKGADAIHFAVDNAAVEKEIQDIKTELLTCLRRKLNNGGISLTISIDEQPTTGKLPYTPREKFEYLAAKNPALIDLKNQLDLDIGY